MDAYDTAIAEQEPDREHLGIPAAPGWPRACGHCTLSGLAFEAIYLGVGLHPEVSVAVCFAAGGAAYGPALTDVIVMAPQSRCSSPAPTWCAA